MAWESKSPIQKDRFVSFASREHRSSVPFEVFSDMMQGETKHKWRGVQVHKSIFEMTAYPLLIQELKPQFILELGAYQGGSGVWLSDLTHIFEMNETHVCGMRSDF